MPQPISLSNGDEYVAELQVWDDLSNPRPGWFRLYWAKPGASTGTPAIGHCSPGGTYRTIKAAIADGVKRFGEVAKRVR